MMGNKQSIAFASGKGGTGKTSLAVNFAKFMSQYENVELLDLDVEEPNAIIYFQDISVIGSLRSNIKIPSFDKNKCVFCCDCSLRCNFNAIAVLDKDIVHFPELCKGCGRCKAACKHQAIEFVQKDIGAINQYADGSLTIIEGRLNTGSVHTKELIKDVKLQSQKEFSILDCPPGTTCPMVESIIEANYVILVTEPTPFGLHDLSLAVEAAQKLKKRFGMIINKSGPNDMIIEEYCIKNGFEIIERIPFSKETAIKCINGKLYYSEPFFMEKMENIRIFLQQAVV
jgi:MinD superfamily P-loop ATPase